MELWAEENSLNFNFGATLSSAQSYEVSGVKYSIDPFVEFDIGVSYQTELSELWNTSYGAGLTASKQDFKNIGSEQVYGTYAKIEFEYQQFDENIKPFLGLKVQKPFSSSNEIDYEDKFTKTLGFNFSPSDHDYIISLAVSHSD